MFNKLFNLALHALELLCMFNGFHQQTLHLEEDEPLVKETVPSKKSDVEKKEDNGNDSLELDISLKEEKEKQILANKAREMNLKREREEEERNRERQRRETERKHRGSVEFVHPDLKDELKKQGEDPNNPWVWLTSYSRIPVNVWNI